jgi:hypothetical protein
MVDHLVTYVLYHSDQVSPDSSDMNSKWFTCHKVVSIIRGSGSELSPKGSLK